MTRRELLVGAGAGTTAALGLKELIPEEWGKDLVVNSDFDRMPVGNAVYVTTYADIDTDELALEYQAPGSDEWEELERQKADSRPEAFTYAFHEEVEEPGDYRFRGVAYENEDVEASDREVVEFVEEIESSL